MSAKFERQPAASPRNQHFVDGADPTSTRPHVPGGRPLRDSGILAQDSPAPDPDSGDPSSLNPWAPTRPSGGSMSDNDESNTFWAVASRPRYPHSRYLQAAYNRPQAAPPEPQPAPAAPETVAGDLSMLDYVAAREANGIRSAEDLVGIDPRPDRTGLIDDEVAQLMPWRSTGTKPTQGRQPDYEQAAAARYAARNTSLAVPQRYTNTTEGR